MSSIEEAEIQTPPMEGSEDSEPTLMDSSSSSSDSSDSDSSDDVEPMAYTRPGAAQTKSASQTRQPEPDSDSENTPENNIRRFTRILNSKRLRREEEEEELEDVEYHEDLFDFPEDPEDWREEDLKELWADAPIQTTKPGWDPNLVDEEDMDMVADEIAEGRDPPIAPFYVPYRKPYPVIPDDHYDISSAKAVVEELDRIEEFLKWVSFIFPDGSTGWARVSGSPDARIRSSCQNLDHPSRPSWWAHVLCSERRKTQVGIVQSKLPGKPDGCCLGRKGRRRSHLWNGQCGNGRIERLHASFESGEADGGGFSKKIGGPGGNPFLGQQMSSQKDYSMATADDDENDGDEDDSDNDGDLGLRFHPPMPLSPAKANGVGRICSEKVLAC